MIDIKNNPSGREIFKQILDSKKQKPALKWNRIWRNINIKMNLKQQS